MTALPAWTLGCSRTTAETARLTQSASPRCEKGGRHAAPTGWRATPTWVHFASGPAWAIDTDRRITLPGMVAAGGIAALVIYALLILRVGRTVFRCAALLAPSVATASPIGQNPPPGEVDLPVRLRSRQALRLPAHTFSGHPRLVNSASGQAKGFRVPRRTE